MLRVCFNCYGNYTTDSVYQWDQNHTLQITGLTLDIAPTVHFCNKKSTEAICVQAELVDNVITVPVPNELLQEPYNIIAYVHYYDDNHAKTIETVNIPLIKRVKPDDYQFIKNIDVMNFERLEKDITDLTNLMADYRSDIDQNLETFENDTTQRIEELETDTNEALTGYEVEMATTLQECRDVISALQLEYRNLDGGTPTTEAELYTNDYNGGYPVSNS